MVGETDRELARVRDARPSNSHPDSVTIYQMEIPYNTTIFKEMKVYGQTVAPVATWKIQARMGGVRIRRTGERGLHRGQRLHRGEGSRRERASSIATAVERRRHAGHRRGFVLPRAGHPLTRTSTNSRAYYGEAPPGCAADVSRAHAHGGRAHDPRVHPAS